MGRLLNLAGQRFGKLVAIERSGSKSGYAAWRCMCDCGKIAIVASGHLNSGHTASCGCQRFDTRRLHGRKKTPTYATWSNMVQRCTNPNNDSYPDYGGRGITVCDRWRNSFLAFLEDMGEKPAGLTIERLNNEAGYSKENCCWATRKQQANNRRKAQR